MQKTKKTSIVILPTYNERENITNTVETLEREFKKIDNWRMGILVVDDTSPDKTYEVVKKLQKKYKNLYLLLNKQKSGLGGAYLKGMEYAFGKLGADVVFEFDADLSHDPKKLGEFLKKVEQGSDMVLGTRYQMGGSIPGNWGLHRKLLSQIGNLFIMTVMLNFSIRDWTSGYRAITKKVWQKVAPELSSKRFTGYTFQIGFLYHALKNGFKVGLVPYHFSNRVYGESKIGPEYIKNTLAFVLKVRLNDLLHWRIFKFAIVGGIGATVQLITLNLFRLVIPSYQLSYFLSVEMAVLSNFIFNNIWTFSDRKLSLSQVPVKFIHFNLASAGSIIIQQIVAIVGEWVFGLEPLFIIPMVGVAFDSGTLYAIIGILIGMSWNFFAYNAFIWKKKAGGTRS